MNPCTHSFYVGTHTGVTTSTYDSRNNLLSVSNADGKTVSYSYEGCGQCAVNRCHTMTDSDGSTGRSSDAHAPFSRPKTRRTPSCRQFRSPLLRGMTWAATRSEQIQAAIDGVMQEGSTTTRPPAPILARPQTAAGSRITMPRLQKSEVLNVSSRVIP